MCNLNLQDTFQLMVKFTMTIGPAGFTTDQYKVCANLTEVHLVNSSIGTITDLSGCPNISAESNWSSLSFTQVSTCNGSRKYGDIDGKDFCCKCIKMSIQRNYLKTKNGVKIMYFHWIFLQNPKRLENSNIKSIAI